MHITLPTGSTTVTLRSNTDDVTNFDVVDLGSNTNGLSDDYVFGNYQSMNEKLSLFRLTFVTDDLWVDLVRSSPTSRGGMQV